MAIPADATAGAALRSSHAQSDAVVIEAHGGEAFVPGPPGFIVGADYVRNGWDLKLADKDGHEAVIKDFFKGEHPPELVSPEGAHISADLAMKLAGSLAPGQYAQAAPGAAGGVPIGQVQTVQGAATATHADGTKVTLAVGTPIFQGDILETGPGGAMGIVFIDKTTFAMQDESRMVVDRLIFDPGSKQGSQVFSLLQGAFVAVTGEIAQTNPQAVTINTPVAAIGIRGTEFAVLISQQLGQTLFTLLAGAISVSNALGQVILNTAGLTTIGTSFNAPPVPPFTLPQAQFNTLYGAGAAITEQLRPFGVRPQQQQQQQQNPNELQQVLNIEPGAGPDQQGQPGANKTFGANKMFGDALALGNLQIAYGLGLGPDSGFKFGESNPLLFGSEGNGRHHPFFIVEETAANGPHTIEILPGDDPDHAIVRDGTVVTVANPDPIPPIIGSSGNDTLTVRDLSGTAFANDVIFFFGNGGNDILNAQEATNPIVADGGPGNDVFNAGSGNDILAGGTGIDVLDGAAGNDIFIWQVGDGNDTVSGGDGFDVLLVNGGGGNDRFEISVDGTGAVHVDDLVGGGSTIMQGVEEIQINGGDGNDIVTVHDLAGSGISGDTIVFAGGAGDDTLDASATGVPVEASGEAGNDSLTGGGVNDTLIGGAGDDTLIGAGGADALDGGTGTDTASYVGSAAVNVSLATGTGSGGDAEGDTLTAIENLIGSANADVLTGNGGGNVLSGGGGNDTLDGGAGNDTLLGEAGDDLLTGGVGADVLDGGDGIDTASYAASSIGVTVNLATGTGSGGDAQGDTLTAIENLIGSAYVDVLTGNGSVNTLSGGAGDDTLIGAGGADALDGGDGIDTASYVGSAAVNVSLATGTGSGGDAEGDTLTAIENLVGSSNADVLTGDGNVNVLYGNGGDDMLDGGSGADTMAGGSGDDTYIVDNAGDQVIENGGEGTDTVQSTISYTLADDVENLTLIGSDAVNGTGSGTVNIITGNAFDNVLSGLGGADTLYGAGGNDTLHGGDDNDTLDGGGGNDTLDGEAGADTMVGGAGNDTYIVDNPGDVIVEDADGGIDTVQISSTYALGANLENLTLTGSGAINGTGNDLDNIIVGNSAANTLTGGIGADTLTGGDGADIFRYTNANEFGDVLTDFESGVDMLVFEIASFPNSSSATFNVIAGPYDGTNGDLTGQYQAGHDALIYSTSDKTLYYDSNGDTAGGYTAVATVQGGGDIAAADIQVT